MLRYLLFFIPFTILVALVTYFSSNVVPSVPIWLIFGYFTVLTLGFHTGLVYSAADRPQVFIRYYMATTTLKLLLHLAVIVFYSFLNKEYAVPFIVTFMVFYAVFTVFEVVMTFSQFKK